MNTNPIPVTHAFALLISLPEQHLESGLELLKEKPKIAYGSHDFEVFRQVDEMRGDRAVEVFIHATMSQGATLTPKVSLHGIYMGHVPSRMGRHPKRDEFRPQSTLNDSPTWAIFWEMTDLKVIKPQINISALKGFEKKEPFKSRFIPEKPVIIKFP